jgi:ABC-type transporter Mla subunit MlaD
MVNYEHLKEVIAELEDSVKWVKTLADVAILTKDASNQLADLAKAVDTTQSKSGSILDEINSVAKQVADMQSTAQNQLDLAATKLTEAVSTLSKSQIDLRQQVLSDLSTLRRDLSNYHQDQIDRLTNEVATLKKGILQGTEQQVQHLQSELSTQVKNETKVIQEQFEASNKKLSASISEQLEKIRLEQEQHAQRLVSHEKVNRIIMIAGFVLVIAWILMFG